MVFLRVAVVILFAIVALTESQHVDLKRSFRVSQSTLVMDTNDRLVCKRQVNMIVWGDFNRTTDKNLISTFVQEKVDYAQSQPDDVLLDQEVELEQLPLQVNVTFTEMVQVVQRPQKNVAVWLNVQIFGQNKHHYDLADILSTMDPKIEYD